MLPGKDLKMLQTFLVLLFFLVVLKLESATHGTIGVFITGEKDE